MMDPEFNQLLDLLAEYFAFTSQLLAQRGIVHPVDAARLATFVDRARALLITAPKSAT